MAAVLCDLVLHAMSHSAKPPTNVTARMRRGFSGAAASASCRQFAGPALSTPGSTRSLDLAGVRNKRENSLTTVPRSWHRPNQSPSSQPQRIRLNPAAIGDRPGHEIVPSNKPIVPSPPRLRKQWLNQFPLFIRQQLLPLLHGRSSPPNTPHS